MYWKPGKWSEINKKISKNNNEHFLGLCRVTQISKSVGDLNFMITYIVLHILIILGHGKL